MRRDTHKGLEHHAPAMREVKTHIYMAGIGEFVRQQQEEQVSQKRESSKEIMLEWQEQQNEMVEAESKNGELLILPQTKETKTEIKELGKRINSLRKSIASLAQQINEHHQDIEMIKGGMIFVGTGLTCKKTGAEKFKAVPLWEVMPDQAVYNATWADEQSKKRVQDILCGMSVHAQLLEEFHTDVPSLGCRLSDGDLKNMPWSMTCTAGNSFPQKPPIQDGTLAVDPPTLWSMLNKSSDNAAKQQQADQPAVKKQKDAVKAAEEVEDGEETNTCVSCFQNSAAGVKCGNGHFICTCCISMLILVEMEDLDKLRKNLGILRCPRLVDKCPPLGGEDLECVLRRVCTSVYDEYRTLQRKAYKLKEILSEATGCLPDIPAHWTSVGRDKYSVHLVPVVSGSPEYMTLLQRFRKTCKQEHIVGIERIQNFEQWSLYREKKRALVQKNKASGVNERSLFHGTHPAAVALINQKSFNRSYCGRNATVYGRGVYFARDASYSASDTYSPPDDQGIKYMYVVSVLAGCTVEGDDDMVEPPPRPDGQGNFDTTCGLLPGDAPSDPSITVVYHDAQAYAEYLIRFRG